MNLIASMPRSAAIAVNDLLDTCAEIKPGQQVLIVAATDGPVGGTTLSMKPPSPGFRRQYNNEVLMPQCCGRIFRAPFMHGVFRLLSKQPCKVST